MSIPQSPAPDLQWLTLYRGCTWIFGASLVGPNGPLTDADVADVQVRIAWRGGVLLDLNMQSGVAFITGQPSAVMVTIPPTEQTALTLGPYDLEIRAVTTSGEAYVQVSGLITVVDSLFSKFPQPPTQALDFSDPANSGLIPAV